MKLSQTVHNCPWAVVYCLRKFHTFIHGRRGVTVLTDHKPLIHILKQQNLCAALQQWLDVLLDYDLNIIYRPGILHVIPDALSRMYMSAYADNVDTWGVHDNIRILNAFNKSASPSDFLCQQSIDAIKPPTVVKKRHQATATSRSGGGNNDNNNNNDINDNNNNDIWLSSQLSLSSLLTTNDSSTEVATVSSEYVHEFECARDHVPLLAAAVESVPTQLCYASVGATSTLTNEEKLLIAQEKEERKYPLLNNNNNY